LCDQVKLVNLTDTRNLVIGIAILLIVLLVFLYLFTIVLGDDQVILISINTIITYSLTVKKRSMIEIQRSTISKLKIIIFIKIRYLLT